MPKPICYGITSKLWYSLTRLFRTSPSWRNITQTRYHQPIVVAVGGNSFAGLEAATAKNIIELSKHHRLVITHGNGPQVGKKLEAAEEAGLGRTINECTAETQLEIGRVLRKSLRTEANRRGVILRPEIIPTKVIVNPKDPAFKNPTKYIGRDFPWERINQNSTRRADGLFDWVEGDESWVMKEVPGNPGIFRRVVPSPKPIRIQPDNLREIQKAIFLGKMAIAAGGGGIPVLPDGTAVEAVIDKDLATALLCREIKAQSLVISTGVKYVAHYFGLPSQEDILYYRVADALWKLRQGQYPAGAMGEKIEAAINALRFGVNEALITHPEAEWAKNEGTTITRGLDLGGRLYNLARLVGLISKDLQRWLVT